MITLTIYERFPSFRVVLGAHVPPDNTDTYAVRVYTGESPPRCIDAALQKETREDIRDRLAQLRGAYK